MPELVDLRLGDRPDAKSPDAAWRFLRFLASPEAAEIIAGQGYLPAYRTDAVHPAIQKRMGEYASSVAVLLTAQWQVRHLTSLPSEADRAADRAVSQALSTLLTGKGTWEEAFAAYQQAVAELE